MKNRHEVSVGDELCVFGHVFIVTEVALKLGKPPTMTAVSPIALMEEPTK